MNYADYSSEEIQNELQNKPLLIPVGAIEQHGPHLPLSVDLDIATSFVHSLAPHLHAIVAPAIAYGARSLPHSGGGPSFPGTVYVKGDTLIRYFQQVFTSYIDAGAKHLIIINAHYENEPFLFEALELCREDDVLANTKVICLSWWNVVQQSLIDDLFGKNFPGWHAEHASTVETSLMLHIKPEKVKPIRVDHNNPPPPGIYQYPVPEDLSHRGVLARTTDSNAELGKQLYEHICDKMLQLIKQS